MPAHPEPQVVTAVQRHALLPGRHTAFMLCCPLALPCQAKYARLCSSCCCTHPVFCKARICLLQLKTYTKYGTHRRVYYSSVAAAAAATTPLATRRASPSAAQVSLCPPSRQLARMQAVPQYHTALHALHRGQWSVRVKVGSWQQGITSQPTKMRKHSSSKLPAPSWQGIVTGPRVSAAPPPPPGQPSLQQPATHLHRLLPTPWPAASPPTPFTLAQRRLAQQRVAAARASASRCGSSTAGRAPPAGRSTAPSGPPGQRRAVAAGAAVRLAQQAGHQLACWPALPLAAPAGSGPPRPAVQTDQLALSREPHQPRQSALPAQHAYSAGPACTATGEEARSRWAWKQRAERLCHGYLSHPGLRAHHAPIRLCCLRMAWRLESLTAEASGDDSSAGGQSCSTASMPAASKPLLMKAAAQRPLTGASYHRWRTTAAVS